MKRLITIPILLLACFALSQVVYMPHRRAVFEEGGGGGGGWTPADLPGVTIWLRADSSQFDGFSNGQDITNWTDEVQSFEFTNTLALSPWYTNSAINGKPAIYFGPSDHLKRGGTDNFSIVGPNSKSIFFVAFLPDNNTLVFRISDISANSCYSYFPLTSPTYRFYHGGSTGQGYTEGSGGVITNMWLTVEMLRDGTTAAYVNIQNTNSVTDSSVNTSLIQTNDVAMISYSSGGLKGTLAEIIVSSNYISGGDLDSMRSYITTKYGIP